jgi:hypothetical protein
VRQVYYCLNFDGFGQANVADDGTPVITINPSKGRSEETIVHELFHQKMRLEGYSPPGWKFPNRQMATDANKQYMSWLNGHLFDAIVHKIIFPEMQNMGINPYSDVEKEFNEAIQTGHFKGLHPATEQEALAMYYVKAKIETGNTDLFSKTAEWYKRKGWIKPVEIGQSMLKKIEGSDLNTPEAAVSIYIQCLNLLLLNKVKFEADGWFYPPFKDVRFKVGIIKVLAP